MRKTIAAVATALSLAAAPAFAADLPVKAAPYVPPPVWSWTGFYIGAHVGAGWGQTESTITGFTAVVPGVPTTVATGQVPFNQLSRSGVLGGGQAGYNWQTGWVVLGVQGDIAGMDVKGTNPCAAAATTLFCRDKSDWLATVSGRIGAVILDRGLIYAKGGGAWLHSTNSTNLGSLVVNPPGFNFFGPFAGAQVTNASFDQGGWLLGFGTEWMITRNWTAFVEYDYMEFDKKNVAFRVNPLLTTPASVTVNSDIRNTLSIAKVGVNYKFDWAGPVVAKY